MDPSALRQLLAVLREGGATSASFYPDGTLQHVDMRGAAQPSESDSSTPAVFQDDANDLPPGAYDVVARAKREGK